MNVLWPVGEIVIVNLHHVSANLVWLGGCSIRWEVCNNIRTGAAAIHGIASLSIACQDRGVVDGSGATSFQSPSPFLHITPSTGCEAPPITTVARVVKGEATSVVPFSPLAQL